MTFHVLHGKGGGDGDGGGGQRAVGWSQCRARRRRGERKAIRALCGEEEEEAGAPRRHCSVGGVSPARSPAPLWVEATCISNVCVV